MVKRRSKKMCQQDKCSKQPQFNFESEHGGSRFCAQHKLQGMVNVKNRANSWERVGCDKRPPFNYSKRGHGGRHGAQRAVQGMLNARNHIDNFVVGPTRSHQCHRAGCSNFATFNFLFLFKGIESAVFCAAHRRLEGMLVIL